MVMASLRIGPMLAVCAWLISVAVFSSCGSSPKKYWFGNTISPDDGINATWFQDPRRGDVHWVEDCVELVIVRLDQGPGDGESCSFVGITGDNLKMKWPTSRRLEITYPPGTKVIKADPKWNDVTITYAEDPKLQKY
jgi:hypothetical protein